MSQENVEIVRLSWDAFRRGDLDGLIALYDLDVVLDLSHFRDWPEGTYVGHAGARRFLAEWLDVWGDLGVGVDEFVTVPDGRVMVLGWLRGRGRQSGLTMNVKVTQINTVRNGKLVYIDHYDDRVEALKAVGLEE